MAEYGFSEGMDIGFAKRAEPGAKRTMVFDWDRAAALISGAKPREAEAGLEGDWDYTGGAIYRNGAPVAKDETYTYLASFWAHPQIEIDGIRQDCWRYADDGCGWNADTYWPASALEALGK